MSRAQLVSLSVVSSLGFLLGASGCNADRALETMPAANVPFMGPSDASGGATGTAPEDASVAAFVDAPSSVDVALRVPPPMPAPAPTPVATCGTPPGPAVALSSTSQMYAAMTGRWQFCSGRDVWKTVGAPADAIGVEYTSDGRMYYLVAGAGGAVRGVGFDYQLTYEVLVGGQVNMKSGGWFFGTLRYSSSPRELELAPFAYVTSGSTLVPFADAPDAGATPPPVTSGPACVATCGTPPGTVQPLTTVDATYRLMEGRWLLCDSVEHWKAALGAPSAVVGLEFGPASRTPTNGATVGGNLYFLVEGPGGLVRADTSAFQPTYNLTNYLALRFETAPNVGREVSVHHSPCPRELELPGMGEPSTVLVSAP